MKTLKVAWLLACALAVLVVSVGFGLTIRNWWLGAPLLLFCAGAAQECLEASAKAARQ